MVTRSVLLVDDDPLVLEHTQMLLESLGCAVQAAADAASALSHLDAAGPFDLLIVDLTLGPGLDGPALAAHALERQPDLPVLFMSGYSDQAAAARADLGGAHGFIAKPFRRQALADAVERAMTA